MHIKDSYEVQPSGDGTLFWFKSIGRKGTIIKWVWFQFVREDTYNLAFGDLIDGQFVDSVVSNNMDFVKVMSTITAIIFMFFDKNPKSVIQIKAVDEKRLRFYNTIFKRKYTEIKSKVIVYGIQKNNQKKEIYNPKLNYHSFEIKLRNS